MKYRFLLTNREGRNGSVEWNHESDAAAREMATGMVQGFPFIQDVAVYRLLTDDSCGPVVFIATVNRNDL